MEDENTRLKQELKAKHDNMVKAAMFGQALMQQNDDLRKEMEEKTHDHSKKMEVKNQEIYSLQQRVDRYAKSEEWLKEEVENLKQAVASQKAEMEEQVCIAKQQEAAPLRSKIEQLELELETEAGEAAQLRERLAQLEELLEEQHNTTCPPLSRTQDMTELEALAQENQALTSELTMQKAHLLDVQSELKLTKQKLEAGQVWAENRAREIEELNCQITSYMNALEKSRLEKMEIQAQMDALRLEAGDHKRKGNSLFAELDDRRVAAEKKVITQQSLQEVTQQKLEMERQQNQKLKVNLSSAFRRLATCSSASDMSSLCSDADIESFLATFYDEAVNSHVSCLESEGMESSDRKNRNQSIGEHSVREFDSRIDSSQQLSSTPRDVHARQCSIARQSPGESSIDKICSPILTITSEHPTTARQCARRRNWQARGDNGDSSENDTTEDIGRAGEGGHQVIGGDRSNGRVAEGSRNRLMEHVGTCWGRGEGWLCIVLLALAVCLWLMPRITCCQHEADWLCLVG